MKFNIYGALLVIISVIIWSIFYTSLPASIPLHWGINGEVNWYANKLIALLLINGVLVLVYILQYIAPKLKRNVAASRMIMNCVMTFLFAISLLILYVGLGNSLEVKKIILIMLGTLFVVMGIIMPRTKINHFFGVRTSWTMNNEEVWEKTNKLGGKLIVVSGIIMIF